MASDSARRLRHRVGKRGSRTAARTASSGQRYASTGAPLGGEFRVNSYTQHSTRVSLWWPPIRPAISSSRGRAQNPGRALGCLCPALLPARACLSAGSSGSIRYTTDDQIVPSPWPPIRPATIVVVVDRALTPRMATALGVFAPAVQHDPAVGLQELPGRVARPGTSPRPAAAAGPARAGRRSPPGPGPAAPWPATRGRPPSTARCPTKTSP